MTRAEQELLLSEKLLKQVEIIDSYVARIEELEAEYAAEMIHLAAIRQLESYKN